MNFAQQQADPRRRIVGFGAVLLFHVLLVYALVTGLAKKVVDVVRAPIETKVIEEIKKPPPPPEVVVPPPPKLEAPPPPFIPPPEIQIANAAAGADDHGDDADAAAGAGDDHAGAAAGRRRPGAAGACAAPTDGRGRRRLLELQHRDGRRRLPARGAAARHRARRGGDPVHAHGHRARSRTSRRIRSSNPIFARNSIRIVSDYKCQGQGRDVTVTRAVRLQARVSAMPLADSKHRPSSPSTDRKNHMRHIHLLSARVAATCASLALCVLALAPLGVHAQTASAPDATAAAASSAPAGSDAAAAPRRPGADGRCADDQGDGRQPVRPGRALGAGRLRRPRHADHPRAHEHGQLVHPDHQAVREPEAELAKRKSAQGTFFKSTLRARGRAGAEDRRRRSASSPTAASRRASTTRAR